MALRDDIDELDDALFDWATQGIWKRGRRAPMVVAQVDPFNGKFKVDPLLIPDSDYLLPPVTLRITASQGVVGKSCGLVSVKCIAGTSITVTIYDNATIAAGTVLFTQVMSAGEEMLFPKPIQSINGIWAVLSGASTFDIGVQDAI
jgi:hypothetical protein